MCRFATTFTPTLLLPFEQNSATSPEVVDACVETLLKHLTLQERIELLGGADDVYVRGNKTIGLPCLKMADGPVDWAPADRRLPWEASDSRPTAHARGVHFMLGPGANIYRTRPPGRNFSRKATRQAE